MSVVPDIPKLFPALPDVALPPQPSSGSDDAALSTGNFGAMVAAEISGAGNALERAESAERAYASGHGELQAMVLERAQADVALSIASATASRASQALTTILAMQI